VDVRSVTVTVDVNGVRRPVTSRRQLETLEAAQGRLPVTVDDGTSTAVWRSATARSSRLPGRPRVGVRGRRFDVLAGGGERAEAAVWVADEVARIGGRALVVGGAVRDTLVAGPGAGVKDLDIEVFGVDPVSLEALLRSRFKVDETGRSFAVFKVAGLDVSLPRTERKTGTGHKGFDVAPDPSLPPEVAALRRDFTINAISWDPRTGELVDPVGGVADLDARRLRVVSDAFDEDPLRVLRGAQFVARFDLTATPDTVARCRSLWGEAAALPRERVWGEWEKMLLRGVVPGAGLRFLDDCEWISHWPQLADLRGVEQDPIWHPEGDVFVHTALCLDAWARLRPTDPRDALVTGFAVLAHDLGRAGTTRWRDGRWTAHGHEGAGVGPARELLGRLCILADLADEVTPLVEHHLAPVQLFSRRDEVSDAAIRRLAMKVGRLDRLVTVARADQEGRGTWFSSFPSGDWLLERAAALGVVDGGPQPILMGRHLVEAGLRPGPQFKQLLAAAFDAQVAGTVSSVEEALALVLGDRRPPGGPAPKT
jgi:tRNA nucleotidyltransferase (CCA-adding enzyme)